MMRRSRRDIGRRRLDAGLTVLELLIAGAILAIVIAVLAQLFSSTTRAYALNERLTDRQQEAAAASQMLTYQVGLAGYQGTGESDFANRPFPGGTFAITLGVDGNDAILVRYYEDRGYGADELEGLQEVLFYVDPEERALMCKTGDASSEVIARGVLKMRVVSLIMRGGQSAPPVPGMEVPEDVAALNVELTFSVDDGEFLWRFPIGLNNRQEGAVL